jgi:flagellar biosynthesis GTPase FlhF
MPDTDPQDPNAPQTFTAEELAAQVEQARREAIEKARTEERDKLYSQIRGSDDRFKAMQAEVEELRKAEANRQKDAEKAAQAAERAKQKAAEAELSAKELVEKRNQEWEQKLATMQQEQADRLAEIARQQEVQQALWAKEKEMADLQLYIRDRVAAEQENIAPELLDIIDGDSREAVDASIEVMKNKTAAIVAGIQQAQTAFRAGMPGVAPSGGATALTPGIDTGGKELSAEDIKGMSMQDFRALRGRMNMPSGSGQGLFS